MNYGLPIIHSTVNIATGRNKPPIQGLQEVLGHLPTYDRTSINSWEDAEFKQAVKRLGRRKLIITALWTEACLTFPALDAIQEELRSLCAGRRGRRHFAPRSPEQRCTEWSKLASGSSAESRCIVNFNATGHARRRSPASWASSATLTVSTLKRPPRKHRERQAR